MSGTTASSSASKGKGSAVDAPTTGTAKDQNPPYNGKRFQGLDDEIELESTKIGPADLQSVETAGMLHPEDDLELEDGEILDGYDVDQAGELVPRPAASQELVTIKEFPRNWLYKEPGYESEGIMQEAALLTERYDARDVPDANAFQHPTVNSQMLNTRQWAAICFPADQNLVLGHLDGKSGTPFVKMSWSLCTQRPSLKLHIKMGGDRPDVTCHIFANSMSRNDSGNVKMAMGANGNNMWVPDGCAQLVGKNQTRDLFAVGLELFTPDVKQTKMGAQPSPPVFDGISLLRLRKIREILESGDEMEVLALSEGEQLIGKLVGASQLYIYRIWPDGGYKVFKAFEDWVGTALDLCARYGNEWFYHAHQEPGMPSIYSTEFELGTLEMPRWMAKKWMFDVDEQRNVLTPPKPVQCAPFEFAGENQVFPNAQDAAFELRLAVDRNRAHQTHILQSSFRDQDFKIRGKFRAHPRKEGCYIVELGTQEGKLLAADKSLRPRVDSRIRLEVAKPVVDAAGDVDMDRADVRDTQTFNGVIVDDLWDSGAEVVCVVGGPLLDLTQNDIRKVRAELRDDATPSMRWMAAVEQISRPCDRDQGVDIPAVVLRAPPSIERTNSMAAEVTPAVEAAFMEGLRGYDLNEKQLEAADNSMQSPSGFTLIQGPPGCGKTRGLMATAEAHIRAGKQLPETRRRQVIACAPSNIAVDAMLHKLESCQNHSLGSLEIVRYKGSFLREKASTAPQTDTEMTDATDNGGNNGGSDDPLGAAAAQAEEDRLAEELQAALWELADEKSPFGEDLHEDYSFYRKRKAAIERWAQNKAHVLHLDAVKYLDVLRKVKNDKGFTRDQRRANRLELEDLERIVTEYYLQVEVDIVFCTNSSAAHGLLREHYQPKVLISDEAGVTTLPDTATPMAAFINHIETIVMAGDLRQQQAVVSSKGSNEFSSTLSVSLFKLIYESKALQEAIVELQVQHRMHPDLSAPLSKIFYKGSLIDHESVVNRDSPKWRTLEAFLAKMKPAYSGNRRLCLDVSGVNVSSGAYNDTTSYYNGAEARIIVDFIKDACAFAPPPNGAQIEPKDFLVLGPYTGQAQLIRRLLANERVAQPGQGKVRVASTRAIQGEEAEFVILSFTRNDKGAPLKMGLASDKYGLCVATSRAREFLLMTGNFKAWVQALEDGAKVISNTGGHLGAFGQLIKDCRQKGDIVSTGDYTSWRRGETIYEPGFPKLIKPKPPVRNQRGGNQRGGNATFDLSGVNRPLRTQTVDQFTVRERALEVEEGKKKKKARHAKKKGPGDSTAPPGPGKPPGPGPPGAAAPAATA